jgi:hypothetical protein
VLAIGLHSITGGLFLKDATLIEALASCGIGAIINDRAGLVTLTGRKEALRHSLTILNSFTRRHCNEDTFLDQSFIAILDQGQPVSLCLLTLAPANCLYRTRG